MKRFVLIFLILINLSCYRNIILIKEVYFKSEGLSEEEKKALVFKRLEKCNTQDTAFTKEASFSDKYDDSVTAVIREAFRKSNNNPWHEVKIYKEDTSCVTLEGYYNEKK